MVDASCGTRLFLGVETFRVPELKAPRQGHGAIQSG